MINMETVRFMLLLDTLSQLSVGGYKPISELREGYPAQPCVYYDEDEEATNEATGNLMCRAVCVNLDNPSYNPDENIFFDSIIDTDSELGIYVTCMDDQEDEERLCVHIFVDDDELLIADGLVYQT